MTPVLVPFPVVISQTTAGDIHLSGRRDLLTLDISTLLHDKNLVQLQWEQMRTFHALHMGWLAAFSIFPTEDTPFHPSVLLKTMFQPTLDKPW